jgi:DNA-binding beta-propeller fold protein YncE
VATIPVGILAVGVAVNEKISRSYVANDVSNIVSVIQD